MGNEASRPDSLSPQDSGVVPSRSPCTPTAGASRHAHNLNPHSSSPSLEPRDPRPQRRTSSSSSLGAKPGSNPRKERTIQRMDKAIRHRVRGGVTYNMKLLIRGANGTGKTSLFQRLQGEPIPETHESTPQLQSATINWKFRQNLEENVKCEVWDVVDRGFGPVAAANGREEGAARLEKDAAVEQEGLQSRRSLPAGVAAIQKGAHTMAIADASTVNVYHEAHGVIFLLDITKRNTLEYVQQQLDNVPVDIPTLVLGNFRDQGAQRKVFKEDVQAMLYGSSDRPQQQHWRRPTELLYFECSLLNCYGLNCLHQYFGVPFLQLKLATIRQQMRIVEGEFTHLKHDVQAAIMEQRYAEYVEHIKTTGSDIRTGRSSSGTGSTPPVASCNNSAISSFNDSGQGEPATQQEDADNGSKENGAETSSIALTAQTSPQEQEGTKSQDMWNLPARSGSTVIQATPPLKFQHKKSMASIPDDATDNNGSKIEGEHALPTGKSSESPLLRNASPSRPKKAAMEEVIHLEDFQVPKTRTSDLDHFYSEDESDEDIGGNDEDVVVAPADGPMKANVSGAHHKQRFLDSDSSGSDESGPTGVQRRRNVKAPHRSSPHRRATKQANATTDQTTLRSHQSSLPPSPSHSPPAAPLSMQKSRPKSPAQSLPSSSIKDSQDVPREESPKQRQSLVSTSGAVLTSTFPAVPPTSASQSNCKSKSENSSAAATPEARVSILYGENELKNESSSSEEPEFTGTEKPISSCGQESPQRSHKRESPKNFSGTYSSAKGANEKAHISTTTENREMSASVTPMQDALDNGINYELVNDLHAPAHTQKNCCIKKETTIGESADSDELNTILAYDGKVAYNHSAAATSQATEDADMPHDSVAARPPKCHPQVRMSDDESDDDTSSATGPTKLPLSSPKESLSAPELSTPSTLSMLSNTEGVKILASQGLEDTMGHYHKRNVYEASDFLSLSALQASLPLPDETALPLPSNFHESTKAPMSTSSDVSDFKANAMSDLQPIPSEALAFNPDLTTDVPSNDLEAFLNESDSELENGSPGNKQITKQRRSGRRVMVESSDDGEEGGQDRFASYRISKKNRSEWRRQQKEDLLQLNAVLNMENSPFAPSASAVAETYSSFVTSGVMEAIRKAKEDAMRMLPTDPVPTIVCADSSLSEKRHTRKHKKEHKKENEEGSKKGLKKSSRKSGLTKKRRPHVLENN